MLTCPDDGLVCCFCSSAHSFALGLPPDPSSRKRPCRRLVLLPRLTTVLDSNTGDLHPISSRPCRAYTGTVDTDRPKKPGGRVTAQAAGRRKGKKTEKYKTRNCLGLFSEWRSCCDLQQRGKSGNIRLCGFLPEKNEENSVSHFRGHRKKRGFATKKSRIAIFV